MTGQPADLVLTGKYLLTMDANRTVIENGGIAVAGDRIIATGPAEAITGKIPGRRNHCRKNTA